MGNLRVLVITTDFPIFLVFWEVMLWNAINTELQSADLHIAHVNFGLHVLNCMS
jgi:hypothetical protein